jgi:hypothetical protein
MGDTGRVSPMTVNGNRINPMMLWRRETSRKTGYALDPIEKTKVRLKKSRYTI